VDAGISGPWTTCKSDGKSLDVVPIGESGEVILGMGLALLCTLDGASGI
jgi:hypothetical protein